MNSDSNHKDLSGITVLIVEDNTVNIFVATKFIEKWSGHVIVAENGEQAVVKARELKPSLILMDLQMPVMDGYEATAKIREFDKVTPIIALTASATLDTKDKTFDVGMNDYISKPFNPSELYVTIKKYARTP
jgi:CheY-like chemotaxis protein